MGVSGGECVVLDTMCLMHYALADRLDVLGSFLVGCRPFSTVVVRGELLEKTRTRDARISNALSLPWLEFDPLNNVADLDLFADWTRRVGAGTYNTGEASVFAVAEKLRGIAITDDTEATRVARNHGLEVHGNLWILARSCCEGKTTVAGASTMVDMLRATGLRLPCTGAGFESWARRYGLLRATGPGT
jgi:predicted nucleic acid-binding protein